MAAGGSASARRHLAFDEVGSTNSLALEAARSGDPGSLWITAERQSAGRGRRDRTWVSERGNLYASLLVVDAAPVQDLMNLPLVAALGVRNGLAGLGGAEGKDIRIKWPNDILVGGRKCVGILVETEQLADGRRAAVIGCGVNVEAVPDGTLYPVTGLRREGFAAGLPAVFGAVAGGVENALALWAGGRNFAAIRRGWLEHAAGVGKPCTVNLPGGSVAGTFDSLDGIGRLVLVEADGSRRTVAAGDVFLPASVGG